MSVEMYRKSRCIIFIFFFQAEDGIRDYKVTGVQTCALPIYITVAMPASQGGDFRPAKVARLALCEVEQRIMGRIKRSTTNKTVLHGDGNPVRSEEHTSELQSPCNLVCRLLLEKKKYATSMPL